MTASELVFHTNPMSRGRIARWMLEEVGAPYETVVLDYGTTMKADAYLAINPMGKVPAITHGDVVVWGGVDRMRYHAVLPLRPDSHPLLGPKRINLTFRKAA